MADDDSKERLQPSTKARRAGALKKFEDFARASDQVEWVDPTGAWEAIESQSRFYHAGSHGSHGNSVNSLRMTEYGVKLCQFYATAGLSHGLIAERLGLGHDTFRAMIRHDDRVREALAKGTQEGEYELQECLMGMARRGNVIAAIFLLKARHGWRDNDPPAEAKPAFQIVVNAPLPAGDYAKIIAAGATPMALPSPDELKPVLLTEGTER